MINDPTDQAAAMWRLAREGKFVTDPEFVPEPESRPTKQIGRLTQVEGALEPDPTLAAGFGGRPTYYEELPDGRVRYKPGGFAWPAPMHNDLLGIVSPGGTLPEGIVPYAERPVKTENHR